MPLYRYVALDQQGQERQGSITADDVRTAASQLRTRQLFVVRLETQDESRSAPEQANAVPRPTGFFMMPISAHARVQFFRQNALMLRSGLTLLGALDTVRDTCGHPQLADVSLSLRGHIERGGSFSEALATHPRVFPALTVELVRSAEASGELDQVLERIGDDQERTLELKRNFLTSLTYPGIVFLSAIGVGLFLLVKVVPAFSNFFAKSGKPMPPGLRNLIGMSDWFLAYGHWLGFMLMAAFVTLTFSLRQPAGRLAFDRFVLRLPMIGELVEYAALTRLSWALAMLLHSGVTVIEALHVGQAVVGNSALALAMQRASEQVLAGRELSVSLRQPPLPYFISRMAGVGEQTGALVEVFQEVGDFYQKRLQMKIKFLTAMVEPVLILVVGGMVGYVYFAFLQAMFGAL